MFGRRSTGLTSGTPAGTTRETEGRRLSWRNLNQQSMSVTTPPQRIGLPAQTTNTRSGISQLTTQLAVLRVEADSSGHLFETLRVVCSTRVRSRSFLTKIS